MRPGKRAPLTKAGHERRVRRAKAREHVVVTPRWYALEDREAVAIVLAGLKTVNELNGGKKWYEIHGKDGFGPTQRLAAKGAVDGWLSDPSHRQEPSPPYVVTLTRWAPGVLDDDGLRAAMKRVRDGVAAGLGVDDGPGGPVVWRYDQQRGPFKTSPPSRYAVEIRIDWTAAPAVFEPCGERDPDSTYAACCLRRGHAGAHCDESGEFRWST